MPKFRKKPIVIDAVQWDGKADQVVVYSETWGLSQEIHFYVTTAHEQKVYLALGDWIIPEPEGRGFYPVKADIFAATYDPV